MAEGRIGEEEVFRFLLSYIDTVPHLEALLLLWNSRPAHWGESDLAERLFVDPNTTRTILSALVEHKLIRRGDEEPPQYWYESSSMKTDRLLEAVERTYRRELIRVTKLIHSKTLSAAKEFARAFKFTKD